MTRLILPLVGLALLSALSFGAERDSFAFVRPFHPVERVVKEETDPIPQQRPGGGVSMHYSYHWVRVFSFKRVTPKLLKALRKRVVRADGQVAEHPGEWIMIRLSSGREGTFDYRRKQLRFDEPNPPKPHARS